MKAFTFFVLFAIGGALYLYVDRQNELTRLKIQAGKLNEELSLISKKNEELKMQMDALENPQNLIELIRLPQYAHLKHPYVKDILLLPEGVALGSECR